MKTADVGMVVIDHGLPQLSSPLRAQNTTFRLLTQNDVLYTPYKFCTVPQYVESLQLIVDREQNRMDEGYEKARLFLRQLAENQYPARYYIPAPPSGPSSEDEDDEGFAVRPVSLALADTESYSEEEEREE
ncbi:unnamed protein product [Allacma fusca]|uniref:Uncharacterized protein n=1 Tax=Allacma fusca TaxID=39272 RepID=A0A8J2KE37_9HEXA|nr:unnamed protein product [Allacma fusca]